VTAILLENFGLCIFEWDTGQLKRVQYDSEWKQIRREQRRGPIDRRVDPERRRLDESVCVPIRDEKKEQRRKNLKKRRDERRLTCEHCRKDFPDVPSMVEHLPCKASHELVHQGFWDFINGIAQNGGPSKGEAERVGRIILASLSGDAYRLACSDRIFLPQRFLTDEEKLRDYRLAWLAAFLSLVRPGQIRLDLLTRTDCEEISRIAATFVRVPDGPRRKMVAQLFFRSMRLEEIGKTGRIPEKPISDKTRTAFLETEGRRGQQRAKAMTFLGADYWSPLTPLQAYESDPEKFSRDLYDLKSRSSRKSRKFKKSSPTRH
jgi:hypothetical protein